MGGVNRPRLRQLWLVAFIVGVSMINYPFLQIFNRPALLWGFPLLYLFFLVGWGASIAVIISYARALKRQPPAEEV